MYKKDMVLNDPQWSICNKTKPSKITVEKGMNPLYPPAMAFIVSPLFFYN